MKNIKKDITNELQSLMETRNFKAQKIKCTKCKSYEIVRNGNRRIIIGLNQRYKCKNCDYRFTYNVKKHKKQSEKITVLIIELHFKGFSLRKIRNAIYQVYDLKIHHMTVGRWIKKYIDGSVVDGIL